MDFTVEGIKLKIRCRMGLNNIHKLIKEILNYKIDKLLPKNFGLEVLPHRACKIFAKDHKIIRLISIFLINILKSCGSQKV